VASLSLSTSSLVFNKCPGNYNTVAIISEALSATSAHSVKVYLVGHNGHYPLTSSYQVLRTPPLSYRTINLGFSLRATLY
jgi:hypothetical protein